MNPSIEAAIPAVIFFAMTVVGLDLSLADFRRAARYPRAVVLGILGQLVLLPLIAAGLIAFLEPSTDIVAGMLLLAACPAGGITNYYCYLARANSALSVTLTALATALALVTMPLLLAAGFALFPEVAQDIEIPIFRIIAQLFLMILLPVALGMAARSGWPGGVRKAEPALRRLSLATILVLVGWILNDQREALAGELGDVLLASVLFTALSMFVAWLIGRLSGLSRADREALICEFSARNLGAAVLIAVPVFGRVEFLLFAAILFVTSTMLVLVAIAGTRSAGR